MRIIIGLFLYDGAGSRRVDVMVHRKYMTKLFSALLSGVKKVTRFTLLICQHVSHAGDLISRNNTFLVFAGDLVQDPLPMGAEAQIPPRSNAAHHWVMLFWYMHSSDAVC
jgi:hypothetical protein